ncbi:hypothetical protein R1flu_012689 [Riccia fluitans]|uniref:30S ribosomal protein S6 n=1 Tax=Riccia fluitans TaxID=41844 RepID=A0ABD1ZBA7_9MARC
MANLKSLVVSTAVTQAPSVCLRISAETKSAFLCSATALGRNHSTSCFQLKKQHFSHVGSSRMPVRESAVRVHSGAGIVASLEKDDGKPQKKKKKQPVVDDLLPELDEFSDELQGYLNLELQSGLDMDTYKHYEIMFIIHEKNVDEVQAVIEKVTGFVLENKGFIYRINNWGLRRLAYKIKKAEKGNYVLMNLEISAGIINDLNAMFEKDERVIRHMVMAQKEAVSEDMEPPEEWRPSSASAEGGGDAQEEEDDDEEYDEEEEEEEDEEEEEGDQRSRELILERQK